MNKQLKKKWIEALRSGKYRQVQAKLKHTDILNNPSYCCLGVLCDVIDSKRWKGDTWGNGIHDDEHNHTSCLVLPKNTRRAIHITEEEQNQLTKMNDSVGSNFEKIADYIEKNL